MLHFCFSVYSGFISQSAYYLPLQKNYFYNQISAEFILSLKYSFTHLIIQFAINVGNKFQESESSIFFFTTLIHISTYLPCTFTTPALVVQSRPKMMLSKTVGPF